MAPKESMKNGANTVIVHRLKPGDDFRSAVEWLVEEQNIQAGVLLSVVGSLTAASLRTPSGSVKAIDGPLEIVSGTGTVGSGGIHIHFSVANQDGTTFGGHLVKGCLVNTTVELVIHNFSADLVFDRVLDAGTGYRELVIRRIGG
jgi:hypothetical protein